MATEDEARGISEGLVALWRKQYGAPVTLGAALALEREIATVIYAAERRGAETFRAMVVAELQRDAQYVRDSADGRIDTRIIHTAASLTATAAWVQSLPLPGDDDAK